MPYTKCPECLCRIELKAVKAPKDPKRFPVDPKTMSKAANEAIACWVDQERSQLPKGPISAVDYYSRYIRWAGERGIMFMSRKMFSSQFLRLGAEVEGAGEYRKYMLAGAPYGPGVQGAAERLGSLVKLSPWQLEQVAEKDIAWIQVLKMDAEAAFRNMTDGSLPDEIRDTATDAWNVVSGQLEWSRANSFKVPAGMKTKGWWS